MLTSSFSFHYVIKTSSTSGRFHLERHKKKKIPLEHPKDISELIYLAMVIPSMD